MLSQITKEQRRLILILTAINFFNYVDRQLIFPLFGKIKMEFGVSDFQLGLLGTWFLVIHSLASVPLGLLADRMSRKVVIAASLIFWSFASFATGLAQNFKQLLHIRGIVGIGEAGYAPAASAMITDAFPSDIRGRAQGIFNIGMFAGGTFGAFVGALIVTYFTDWRWAFFLVSPLGLLLAFAAFRLKDTRAEHNEPKLHPVKVLHNRAFIWIVISGTLITFAGGGFIAWGVEFFRRSPELGFSLAQAAGVMGLLVAIAGSLGVYLGAHVGDMYAQKRSDGRCLVLGWFIAASGPLIFTSLLVLQYKILFFILFFLGIMCISTYHGSIVATIHDITPKQFRATAFAVYIFLIHLLGDSLAPAFVGKLSDLYTLKTALLISSCVLFLGALSFFPVARLLKRGKVPIYQQ